MKEWTEIIRDERYFNLLVANSSVLGHAISFNVGTRSGPIDVEYEEVFIINDTMGLENAPTHIAASDVQCHATPNSTINNIIPHAADPAPAQRAGSIAFIWSPESTKTFSIRPYRDDGFPAVVVAVNLSKHYYHGKLHRKSQHPAIKAEYMAGLWFSSPEKNYRTNGPSSIAFDNYKEFWLEGEFKGHRWTDYHHTWKHRALNTPEDEDTLGEFLGELRGTTNMFTTSFFTDAEDEVCYMADFA